MDTLFADGTNFQYISPQPRHDHLHGRESLATATLRVYVLSCCVRAWYATIFPHRSPQKHHCSSHVHLRYLLVRDGLSPTKLHSRTERIYCEPFEAKISLSSPSKDVLSLAGETCPARFQLAQVTARLFAKGRFLDDALSRAVWGASAYGKTRLLEICALRAQGKHIFVGVLQSCCVSVRDNAAIGVALQKLKS